MFGCRHDGWLEPGGNMEGFKFRELQVYQNLSINWSIFVILRSSEGSQSKQAEILPAPQDFGD